jgi:hypothetical protein
MLRRDFIAGLGSVAVWSRSTHAQQPERVRQPYLCHRQRTPLWVMNVISDGWCPRPLDP